MPTGEHVTFGHVGDSRAYRVRDDELEQLTDDHSLVGELIRSGKLTREEADVHPQRSVITRALGTDPDVDVDTFVVDAKPGDIYLLCSDGLSGMVSDESILSIVRDNRRDLQAAAKALIAAANRGGGDDNITVVVFAVDGRRRGGDHAHGRDPATGRGRVHGGRRGHALRPRGGARRRDDGRERRGAPAAGGRRSRRRRARRTSAAAGRRGSVLALVALLAFLVVLALLLLWAAASGGAVVR